MTLVQIGYTAFFSFVITAFAVIQNNLYNKQPLEYSAAVLFKKTYVEKIWINMIILSHKLQPK